MEETSEKLKFAFINEGGMRLIDWVQKFQNFDKNTPEELYGIDFESEDNKGDILATKQNILEASITPFSCFQNQPTFIREFLSLITLEINIIGNILSYFIHEEFSTERELNIKELTKKFRFEANQYINHMRQVIELVLVRLLESIKIKIIEGSVSFFPIESM